MLENLSAYRVGSHQHAPEIAQALGFPVCFVPHLLPVRRGLLATCYALARTDDLRDVARVGRRLLVAGRRGREARLAARDPRRADARAGKDGAVFEN